MSLRMSIFFIFIFPIVFGFVPFQPHYGPLMQYPYNVEGYRYRPVVIQDPNVGYPIERMGIDPNSVFTSLPNDGKLAAVLEADGIEGKSIMSSLLKTKLFKKFISSLDITFNKEKEDPLVVKCREEFGGTLVNNECYKFFKEQLEWEEAREFCKEKGGFGADLWTPDPTDAFLYYKLGYLMPEYGTASGDEIWLGSKFDSSGKKVFDVNGEDITDTFLANVNDFDSSREDNCISFNFDYGGFYILDEECDDLYNFICEFPLKDEEEEMHHDHHHHKPSQMYHFNLFNKFKIGKK